MSMRSNNAPQRTRQFCVVADLDNHAVEPKPAHIQALEQKLHEQNGANLENTLFFELWQESERLRCLIPELPRKRQTNASMCRARILQALLDIALKRRESNPHDPLQRQIETINRVFAILDEAGNLAFIPPDKMGKLTAHFFHMAEIEFPEAFGFQKS